MTEEYIDTRRILQPELLEQIIIELKTNNIEYRVEEIPSTSRPLFVRNKSNIEYLLKVKNKDFENALNILDGNFESKPSTDENIPKIEDNAYEYATAQIKSGKKYRFEVEDELINNGIDSEEAKRIVTQVENKTGGSKEKAKKEMLWGAIWLIGGIALTASGIGLIFIGAILVGTIRLFRGYLYL
mgnify:CR=1 FL=1